MMHQFFVTDCAVLMETHFDFKGKEDSKSEIERDREIERFEINRKILRFPLWCVSTYTSLLSLLKTCLPSMSARERERERGREVRNASKRFVLGAFIHPRLPEVSSPCRTRDERRPCLSSTSSIGFGSRWRVE